MTKSFEKIPADGLAAADHTLGLVGVGNIGSNLWKRLDDLGHRPVIVDVNPDVRNRFRSMGSEVADTVYDLGAQVDTVIISLPTSTETELTVLGSRGLLDGMRPGSMIIDTTSGRPHITQRIGAQVSEKGVEYIDCGVSGGSTGAAVGTLKALVGGSSAAVERAKPVIGLFASQIFHCGPVGAGHTMKTVKNMATLVKFLVELEALALGAKAGLDPVMVGEVGDYKHFNTFLLGPEGKRPVGFSLAMYAKDLEIASEVATDLNLPLQISTTAQQLLRVMLVELDPDVDNIELTSVIERWSGVKLSRE